MVYNFGAGPAMLPQAVMQRARDEFLDWNGTGMSVMEISHRSPAFMDLAENAEAGLRELYALPNDYRVLFLAGGASAQFAMVPMNLLEEKNTADYLLTGHWSVKAMKEAQRFCDVHVAVSSAANGFTSIPDPASWELSSDSAYVFLTLNETIEGVEFQSIPECGAVPLVADLTSTILSRPLDINRFGLVFAGAQKNIAPAGMTIVIIREDLIGHAKPSCPSLYDYAVHVKEHCMFNTPPTFNWYMAGLMFEWIKDEGGLAMMAERNQRKADKLYEFIDASGFYSNPVDPDYRSWMNVPFILADDSLDAQFLNEAEQVGLFALKGHRSVGGMRASLYNGMPEQGIDALISFMQDFERQFG